MLRLAGAYADAEWARRVTFERQLKGVGICATEQVAGMVGSDKVGTIWEDSKS